MSFLCGPARPGGPSELVVLILYRCIHGSTFVLHHAVVEPILRIQALAVAFSGNICQIMSFDYSHLKFARPANQVKTINVDPIPQRIFDGMKVYEDAARGFQLLTFERSTSDKENQHSTSQLFVAHRPADAQVPQIYRLPANPQSTELQRITFFDIGAGRSIPQFLPVRGEDWRGVWRSGGAIMVMDLDGNERFQLW